MLLKRCPAVLWLITALIVLVFAERPVAAQNVPVVEGIEIDAEGVVTPDFAVVKGQRLSEKQLESAAREVLADDVNQSSPLRKVSLVRLEAACRQLLADGKELTPEMQFLAGVQRIDYLFVYPDTNDLVIAGPAEGFAADADGRIVGTSTRRPPLRLDDLVVAFQTLERTGMIGCSIDPVPERLAALQRYVAANNNPVLPNQAVRRFQEMTQVLGMHDVRVMGVPAETHFGQLLVEADYRMKLMALNLEDPRIRGFRSQLELLRAQGNAYQRFWFIPLYEPFQTTEDRTAFQFSGQRAQLLSQEEYTDHKGERAAAPSTRVSTQQFAKGFTDKFPEIAEAMPVFAQMQNLFDLAVLAALIKKERLAERANWERSLFLDAEGVPVPTGPPPKQVAAVFNYKKARRGLMIALLSGGVLIHPSRVVEQTEFQVDPATRLDGIRGLAGAGEDRADAWWWD